MDIEAQVAYWRNGAAEDWEVGAKLVREGRTRHGLFFLHLALEKALKALASLHTQQPAPRNHNLNRLAELAGLALDDRLIDTLADMNQFQIAGRYPELLTAPPSAGEAQAFLAEAQEAFRWLMNR